MHFSILVLVLLGLGSLRAQTPAFVRDSLDPWVQREMARWQVPGMAVTIVKDGQVVLEKGYGVRDLESGAPVDAQTLFMIASNSKIFAGTLLAQMETEGRLKLSDTVQHWLPWFKLSDPEIAARATLTDLITHRLGLQTFQGDLLHWANPGEGIKLVQRMREMPLRKPFRAEYGYCNIGFVAAGLAMEQAGAPDWHTAVSERMFRPLGMTRSSTRREGIAGDANACIPYTLVKDRLVALDYPNIDALGPAASINSSAHDIGRWLMMQLDSGRYQGREVFPWETILKTREARTIMRTVRSPDFPSRHIQVYGLGWYMSDYGGVWVLEHGGGADGFVTTTAIVPELGLGIAVFTNTDMNGLYNALKMQILEAYLGMPYRNLSEKAWRDGAERRRKQAERIRALEEREARGLGPSMTAADYSGMFRHPHLGEMRVWQDATGMIHLRIIDHPSLTAALSPLGGEEFLCRWTIPTYGVEEARFDALNGRWHIKANDFVDYETYIFERAVWAR
jgi:CubicO group peptidase (beta-lactamase class C family)